MTSTNYTIDDYIELIDSYADNFGYEIDKGESVEECAWHVMDWCRRNNHDLDSIPLTDLEYIINLYYHSIEGM